MDIKIDHAVNTFWGILMSGGTVSQATSGVRYLQTLYTYIGDWAYFGTGSATLP